MTEAPYTIIRRPRRKTASIVIHSDNRIEVLAPLTLTEIEIAAWVSSKQAWIRQKLHFNTHSRRPYQAKKFIPGESFSLLGESYLLVIKASPKACIELDDKQLIIQQPLKSCAAQQSYLRDATMRWYQAFAHKHLNQRVALFAQHIGKTPTLVGIKNYRSRWGSCHIDGRIYFNWRIIMAPTDIVDYVVVHELCHLHQHNHSPAYWRLVASIMPDYRKAKQWLKENSLALDL
ncbi:MAG: SprT family zinc-dependent metalloprotease [Mariprofundus sp.]|nr:SprT family zinc-dependent metalloprotease [Mariprofundus sp.]